MPSRSKSPIMPLRSSQSSRSSPNLEILFCFNPIRDLSDSVAGDLPFNPLRDFRGFLLACCGSALYVCGALHLFDGERLLSVSLPGR